jgi:hypothetical protein
MDGWVASPAEQPLYDMGSQGFQQSAMPTENDGIVQK